MKTLLAEHNAGLALSDERKQTERGLCQIDTAFQSNSTPLIGVANNVGSLLDGLLNQCLYLECRPRQIKRGVDWKPAMIELKKVVGEHSVVDRVTSVDPLCKENETIRHSIF